MFDKKKKETCHRPKTKLLRHTAEEVQDILNKYTQGQKTYSREITRKMKRKNNIASPEP
jgi:t-SNARE complex subunit (syntaxin)